MPPVAPMLAKSVPSVPQGALSYEPKWDGFRSIIFRDGDEVEIGSRNGKPMTRYFPEIVEAVKANLPERCVVDGEIVVVIGARLEFEVLQQRIHPASSRVNRLAIETPASFIAFDMLAEGDADLTHHPFAERRAHPAATYAKRFAAKEACAKALGTGFRDGVFFRDLGVVNLPSGRPTMELAGAALCRLHAIVPAGFDPHIDLAITDEYPLAQAFVVISAVQLRNG